jgi:hypothetical protein
MRALTMNEVEMVGGAMIGSPDPKQLAVTLDDAACAAVAGLAGFTARVAVTGACNVASRGRGGEGCSALGNAAGAATSRQILENCGSGSSEIYDVYQDYR